MKFWVLILLVLATLGTIASVGIARLGPIRETERLAFTNMLRNYFNPVIHGVGVGFDCEGDSYITAKFHVVNVKVLPFNQVVTIIREETQKPQLVDWYQVRERVRAAIEENGTIISKGRIYINGTMYTLTNILKTNTTFSADIKEPDYVNCKQQNISVEECEEQATKVGSISLTKGEPTGLPGTPYLWKGSLEFKDKTYKFAAFAYPRLGT